MRERLEIAKAVQYTLEIYAGNINFCEMDKWTVCSTCRRWRECRSRWEDGQITTKNDDARSSSQCWTVERRPRTTLLANWLKQALNWTWYRGCWDKWRPEVNGRSEVEPMKTQDLSDFRLTALRARIFHRIFYVTS